MELTELINKLLIHPLLIEMTYKTKNQVELSGWILRKPKFIKHDKTGVESCSLPLYQITNANGKIKFESFSCMVYVKDLIEQLKKIDKVLFIAAMGKVRHHPKYGDYSQITEIQTLIELELPLADEWKKEKICQDKD